MTETSHGHAAEGAEAMSERDKLLASNKKFWDKAAEDWDAQAKPMRLGQ
ncbi:hypothetical protein [uncultured Bifidobacterium sp.]|nr:hypothetical protein [uncultured Bifidobacterium sp.]